MKLLEILDQYRRDFTGVSKCESCGFKKTVCGYDDDYFHTQVMPNMKCDQCQKSTLELGIAVEPIETKYAPHEVV